MINYHSLVNENNNDVNGVAAETAPALPQAARNVSPRASGKPRTGPRGRIR